MACFNRFLRDASLKINVVHVIVRETVVQQVRMKKKIADNLNHRYEYEKYYSEIQDRN